MTIEKLKKTPPDIDQIPVEMIKCRGRTICSEIHELLNPSWNKEELPEQWKESIVVPIYKNDDKTECINYSGISLLSTMYKILSNILSRLTPYAEEIIGIINVDFDLTGQLLIIYSAFI